MLGNPNWKNEPLHALKLVLSAIKNKDTRKKYLSIYEDFVESLNFVSLKEKKITGLNSQNTPIPSNNIKDPLERQIQVFDYDADEYQIDLALQNLGESTVPSKIFKIEWNKTLNEKIFKGELICFFQAKQGKAHSFDINKIYASEDCILIRKEKNEFFTKNQIVGYVRAFNNDLDFQKLEKKTQKIELEKEEKRKKDANYQKRINQKKLALALLMGLYFVVVIFWDGFEIFYEESWQWWLFLYPGCLIPYFIFKTLLNLDD